jgi:hypothetical protein
MFDHIAVHGQHKQQHSNAQANTGQPQPFEMAANK